mgnify:CR=1 FL=1
MCIICIEFEKGKLKLGEAVHNYGEMKDSLSPEHQKEVEEKLFNNFPFYPSEYDYQDYDADEYWEKTGFGD